jgi:hypothetical protein
MATSMPVIREAQIPASERPNYEAVRDASAAGIEASSTSPNQAATIDVNSLASTSSQDVLTNSIAQSIAARESAAKAITASRDLIAGFGREQVDNIAKEAIATSGAAMRTAQLKMDMAANSAMMLSMLSVNEKDTDNIISQLAPKLSAVRAQREPLLADINDRMSIGFFDNPLEWLMNQTILPGLVGKYNGLARAENSMTDAVDKSLALADRANKVNASAQAQTTTDIAKLETDAILLKAARDALKIREHMSAGDALAAAQLAQLSSHGATEARLLLESEERAWMRKLQEDQIIQMKEIREAEADRKKTKAEEEAAVDSKLKDLGRLSGASISALDLKTRSPKQKDLITKAAGTGRFGQNPHDALEFFNEVASPGNIAAKGSQELAVWGKFYVEKYRDFIAARDDKLDIANYKAKEEDRKEAAATDLVELFRRHQKDLSKVTVAESPYRANFSQILNQSDQYPLIKDAVTKLLEATPEVNKITDAAIVKTAFEIALENKVPRVFAAQQLAAFYQVAVGNNNVDKGITVFSLPMQTNYTISYTPSKGFFPSTSKYDLTNSTSAEKLLITLEKEKLAARGYKPDMPKSLGTIFPLSSQTPE